MSDVLTGAAVAFMACCALVLPLLEVGVRRLETTRPGPSGSVLPARHPERG